MIKDIIPFLTLIFIRLVKYMEQKTQKIKIVIQKQKIKQTRKLKYHLNGKVFLIIIITFIN